MLLSFSDFLTFKQTFLDYKAVSHLTCHMSVACIAPDMSVNVQEKEGKALDLGGLMVCSLSTAANQ